MQAIKDYFSEIFATCKVHTENFGISIRVILILMSLLVTFLVLRKIRKKQLSIDDSLYWILSSFFLLILSIFPQIAFFFAAILGIHDPTNFVFILVILIVCLKLFSISIELSIQKQRLNTLVQKLALANKEIESNTKKIEQKKMDHIS